MKNLGFLIFLASLSLLAWNIKADLPDHFHADEPHHLNVAAHFSTGDLNPHDFKYPTLWNYALAVMLGLLYAFARVTGAASNGLDFASIYFYQPTQFYLGARLLAAGLFSGAAWLFYATGNRYYNRRTGILAGIFLATGPSFWFYSRFATMNSIMVFFVALAVYLLHSIPETGARKAYALSGLAIGLAISSHYIAAPLGVMLIGFHFLVPKEKRRWDALLLGCLCVPLGFAMGSPFFVLDLKKALGDVFALGQLHVVALGEDMPNELGGRNVRRVWQFLQIMKNIVTFLDPYAIGFAGLLLALFLSQNKKTAIQRALWFLPVIAMSFILSGAYHGNFYRYSLSVYVPLVLPAAAGFSDFLDWLGKRKNVGIGIIAVILVLFVRLYARDSIDLGRLDTRSQAKAWLNANIPAGDGVLVTDQFTPQLIMSEQQVQEQLELTEKISHPRRHYYKALAHNHPGGGFKVFFLRRGLVEVEDTPQRTEKAYQAIPSVDLVEEGFGALKNNKISTVVLAEDYIDPERNAGWIVDLKKNCALAITFRAVPGKTKGPVVDIYRCGETRL